MRRYVKLSILFAGILCLLAATPAWGMPVHYRSSGDMLAGGWLHVRYLSGAGAGSVISAQGNAGVVNFAGWFSFSVAGDTFDNTWSLTNLRPDDVITHAWFDLTSTGTTLFDDNDPNPGTEDSASGRAGAIWLAGPVITSSAEILYWNDVQNHGDMWWGEDIFWGRGDFTTNLTSTWRDDTDQIVPEPSSLGLALIGLLLAAPAAIRKFR